MRNTALLSLLYAMSINAYEPPPLKPTKKELRTDSEVADLKEKAEEKRKRKAAKRLKDAK